MINPDIKQRIKVAGIFFLQSYKVITGNMLSLFIPQDCDGKMCTLTENYNNKEVYHQCLFYWNCLSLLLFFSTYFIELRREEWCVKFLDIDNNYPDNFLKGIIIKEKNLDNYMDSINKKYYNMVRITSIIYTINMALTIQVIHNNYHSNSTISCFISFSLLVMMKLYNSINVAYQSVTNDKMMSAYMNEFVSFNVLDEDYVNDKYKGTKNNRLEDITDIEGDEKTTIINDESNDCNSHLSQQDKNTPIKEEEIVPIIQK